MRPLPAARLCPAPRERLGYYRAFRTAPGARGCGKGLSQRGNPGGTLAYPACARSMVWGPSGTGVQLGGIGPSVFLRALSPVVSVPKATSSCLPQHAHGKVSVSEHYLEDGCQLSHLGIARLWGGAAVFDSNRVCCE